MPLLSRAAVASAALMTGVGFVGVARRGLGARGHGAEARDHGDADRQWRATSIRTTGRRPVLRRRRRRAYDKAAEEPPRLIEAGHRRARRRRAGAGATPPTRRCWRPTAWRSCRGRSQADPSSRRSAAASSIGLYNQKELWPIFGYEGEIASRRAATSTAASTTSSGCEASRLAISVGGTLWRTYDSTTRRRRHHRLRRRRRHARHTSSR